jgi:hypothetical protein
LAVSLPLFEFRQELKMSITGVSGAASATYLQQPRATRTTPPAAGQDDAAAMLASLAPSQGGKVHRHHHQGGGAAPASDLLKSGTSEAGGNKPLDILA